MSARWINELYNIARSIEKYDIELAKRLYEVIESFGLCILLPIYYLYVGKDSTLKINKHRGRYGQR